MGPRTLGYATVFAAIGSVAAWNAVDDAMNYTKATAAIARIDRKCEFHTSIRRPLPEGTKLMDQVTREDCDATGELASLLNQGPYPKRKVKGEATVWVSYVSPLDGAPHTDSYKLDGKENEFYTLREGSRVGIRIHNREPGHIKPAPL